MVPGARHPVQLDEAAHHEQFVAFSGRLAEDEVVADDERQKADPDHPFARPTRPCGRPEHGMLEPLEEDLRPGSAIRAELR